MTDVNEQIPSYSFSFLHAFFFFLELSCVTSLFLSFFFFFFSRLFFFFCLFLLFFWSCAVFLLVSVLYISPFSFWGVPNLFFLFLVSFPCFLFSGALCFLSLSFDRLNKPLRNRFLLVLSRFSDRLRGSMVTQSYYTHDTDMPSSGAK